MGREVDSNLPVLQQQVVHGQSLDQRVPVFEVGVAEALQPSSLGVAVAGKPDALDLEFAEELDDVLGVDVVRQVGDVGGVRLQGMLELIFYHSSHLASNQGTLTLILKGEVSHTGLTYCPYRI